jgi:hypothetical protein
MSLLDQLTKLNFINNSGSLSAPSIQSGFGYVIPQSKIFIRIDFTKISPVREHSIDVKNITSEKIEEAKNLGIEIVQTKYFLKKDAYAIMISKDIKKMMYCNVNER